MARNHFKGKRIAIVGLGPHGEMVEDVRYLIKSGALVSVYDMRSEARLKSYVVFLRSIGLANYVCGSVPDDDLLDMDLIVLSREYPRNSTFLAQATEKHIQIEYPETLFFKLAPPITVVGVLGQHGKSTVMSMLEPMLQSVGTALDERTSDKQGFFVSDWETDTGILVHLKTIKNGDILLLKFNSLLMHELHELRISPQVAIFTTMPSKHEYVESPFEALEFQTYNNFLIASDDIVDATRLYNVKPRAKMLRTKASIVPTSWEFQGRAHERMCAALALQAARLFKVDNDIAERVLAEWQPLKGRIELIKKTKNNVEFYNDTGSISPDATLNALLAINQTQTKNTVLIIGGAKHSSNTESQDFSALYKVLPNLVHTLLVLPGSGTMLERHNLHALEGVDVFSVPNLDEAVRKAREQARAGDKVLFSPGFSVGGYDNSRKERGERFVRAVRAL